MQFVFVEGDYDQQFFEMIFEDVADKINIKQYAQEKKKKIKSFIDAINCMPESDYCLC